MTTLCLVSGGIDSTWTLWKVLTTTDDPVVAFHVVFPVPDQQHICERRAVHAVVEWLQKNVRPFEYIEEFAVTRGVTLNMMLIAAFVANLALRRQDIEKIYFGECREENVPNLPGGLTLFRPIFMECLTNEGNQLLLRTAPFLYRKPWPIPELLRPGQPFPKFELRQQLPPDLEKVTWSCAEPVNMRECGRCRRCAAKRGPLVRRDLQQR